METRARWQRSALADCFALAAALVRRVLLHALPPLKGVLAGSPPVVDAELGRGFLLILAVADGWPARPCVSLLALLFRRTDCLRWLLRLFVCMCVLLLVSCLSSLTLTELKSSIEADFRV
jgi:O-antigen ligase